MIRFSERNQPLIGAVFLAALLVLVLFALNINKLPLVHSRRTYTAYFANAALLGVGDTVAVGGVNEGQITSMSLRGNSVKVQFQLPSSFHLGSTTSVAAKVLTPIGQEYLQVYPSGLGHLQHATIPKSQTSIPLTLVGDLQTTGNLLQGINMAQLRKALITAGDALGSTPAAAVAKALNGLAKFSSSLGSRESQLETLVNQGAGLSTLLNQHGSELVALAGQGDVVLKILNQRRAEIKALLATTGQLTKQLSSIMVGDKSQITTLLSNLQSVSAVLKKDAGNLSSAIPVLAAFNHYSANASGSGPYVDINLPTLLMPDPTINYCAKHLPTDSQVGCLGG